jgi:hypothetical protein
MAFMSYTFIKTEKSICTVTYRLHCFSLDKLSVSVTNGPSGSMSRAKSQAANLASSHSHISSTCFPRRNPRDRLCLDYQSNAYGKRDAISVQRRKPCIRNNCEGIGEKCGVDLQQPDRAQWRRLVETVMNTGYHKTEVFVIRHKKLTSNKVDMSGRFFGLRLEAATCSRRNQPASSRMSPCRQMRSREREGSVGRGLRCLFNLFASAAPGKLLAWWLGAVRLLFCTHAHVVPRKGTWWLWLYCLMLQSETHKFEAMVLISLHLPTYCRLTQCLLLGEWVPWR